MSARPVQRSAEKKAGAPGPWDGRSRVPLTLLVAAGSLLAAAAPAAAGVGRWVPLGPFGATVVSLAVMPGTAQTLYAGTADGLFKSADGGTSWTALRFEPLGLAGEVTAVVVVPSDPPAVLAATADNGLFRSADGGSTWQRIAVTAGGELQFQFQALAVDPRDPTIVYAGAGLTGDGGTDSGLFRSTDAGITFAPSDRRIESTVVSSIAIDPFNPRTLYAASPQPSNLVSTRQPTGVFKSIDGGDTWQVKDRGLRLPANESFGLQPGVVQVAVDPEVAGTLYAVVGFSGEVYRSRDGAESWQELPGSPAANALVVGRHGVLYVGGALPGQPQTVFRSIDGQRWNRTAAPTPAALLVPAPETSTGRGGAAPDVVYAASGGGLARSADGGRSWQLSDAGLTSLGIGQLAASGGTVYASAGPDLYRGADGGSAWKRYTVPQTGITELAVDPADPTHLFAATGTLLLSSRTAGRFWRQVSLPDSTCVDVTNVAVAPSDRLTVYAGGPQPYGTGNSPPPCSGGCQTFRSRDGGVSWDCLPLTNVAGFFVDPSDPETVYALEPVLPGVELDSDFAKSSDGGQSWQPIRPGDLGFGAGFRFLVIDPVAPRHLYAVLDLTLLESLDGGQSWAAKGPGIPALPGAFPEPVAALLFDPRDSSVLYASVQPVGVVRSTDGGLSWTQMSSGLPPGAVGEAGALAIDPGNPGLLFLGTADRGVYRLRH